MGIGSDALKILRSMRSPLQTSVFMGKVALAGDVAIGKKSVRLNPTNESISDLEKRLTLIQEALRKRASEVPEGELNDDQALNEIARLEQAKKAARNGDWAQTDRNLRETARWVYDFAASIGVSFPTSLHSEESETVEPHPPSPGRRGGGRRSGEEPGILGMGTRPIRERTVKPASNAIVVSSHFKLIFLSILAIALLSGGVQTALAFAWPEPTGTQHEVFEAMGSAWRLCLGAIVGLLGGKAIK